ncbi:MAG: DUF4419 domain-containing protein [Polyangiaceae bacterium]|nr:DUF4419 domain-containing protein [Polyangiaceae bacterium]
MPVTFPVSDVAQATKRLPVLERQAALSSLLGAGDRKARRRFHWDPPAAPRTRVEALYASDAELVVANDGHAFAQAALEAFYGHYPLAITPDAVWFCLAQGFAHHVGLNAESLRSRFVRHQGKEKLVVDRTDFVLGRPNPWPEAFSAFSDQIATHVGRLRDLVVSDFSTTGPVERAASEVLLMDAFQPYFEYEMRAGCGIPLVTVHGTPADWRSIRRRASALSEFGLESWTKALVPVLDQLVRTADGDVEVDFWRSFFRYQSGSGSAELTGWIDVLFPYLEKFEGGKRRLSENPYIAQWEEGFRKAAARSDWRISDVQGPSIGSIPGSIASAPVRYVQYPAATVHLLRFVAGLFGVVQDPVSGTLAPEFGWAVVEELEEPSDALAPLAV